VQVEGGAAFVSVVGCGKVKGVVFISTLSVTRRGEILCGRVWESEIREEQGN